MRNPRGSQGVPKGFPRGSKDMFPKITSQWAWLDSPNRLSSLRMEGFEEDASRLADPNGSCQGVMAHGCEARMVVSDFKNMKVLGCLGDHHPKYGFNFSVGTTTFQSWNSLKASKL